MKYILFSFLFQFLFLWSCSLPDGFSPEVSPSDVETRLNQYWDFYNIQMANKNLDSALYYMEKVVKLAEAADKPQWVGAAHGKIGSIYLEQGYFGEATFQYLEAVKLYEELGELNRLANAYTSLGYLFNLIEDYETAIHYSHLAKDIFFYEGSSYEKANVYRNLGVYHTNLKQFDKAEKFLHLSEETALEAQDYNMLSQIYNSRGVVNFKQLKYDKAREYYQLAIQYGDSIADGLWIKAAATNNILETYISENNHPLAEEWLHKALERKTEMNNPVFLQSTINLYAEMLFEQRDYKEAVNLLQDNLNQVDLTKINPAIGEGLRLVQVGLSKVTMDNNPDDQPYLSRNFVINNKNSKLYISESHKVNEQLTIIGKQQAVRANVIKHAKNEEIEKAVRRNRYILFTSVFLLFCTIIATVVVVRKNRKYKIMYTKIENVLNNSKFLQHLR